MCTSELFRFNLNKVCSLVPLNLTLLMCVSVRTMMQIYPSSFVTSMALLSIVLSVMLVLQLTFAPYINPPNAPENLRLSPPDLIEVACTTLELVMLLAGYIRFTTPVGIASDILTTIAAALALIGPPAYAMYSRRVHKEWYVYDDVDAEDGSVQTDNPLSKETCVDGEK
eukprot:COSAG02_NODE_3824_length_6185_cov_2.094808_3_plen_169_part_00